jgi:hypothetical protein
MKAATMSDPAETSDLDRYRLAVPEELKAQPYWLVWRFEAADKPGDKPRKVPYYADGARRQGQQGSPEDVARLTSFDAALGALESGRWTGLGYAHVPGCGINSLDFDNCVDASGALEPEIDAFIHRAGTYAELSPSGRGVRLIAKGTLPSIKRIHPDGYNVECFGESGFVTITGRALCGDSIEPLRDDLMQTLRGWLQDDGKQQQRRRSEQLEQIKSADPIYQRLAASGRIKHQFADGRIGIACPFEAEHTSGSGSSDTIYFLPHTLGYPNGHFHCFHSHCAHRTDGDFAAAIGIGFVDLSALTGDRGPIVDAHAFTEAWTPTEYVVKGIVQRGHLCSLTGHSNAGKTAIAIRLAVCVATGQPFGRHRATQGRVVYFAGENADDIRCRLIALAQDLKLRTEDLASWLYVVPLAFPLATHLSAIKEELEKLGELAMLVVDTRAAYASAQDENDNMQALADARAIRELMALPGRPAAVVLNHPPHRAEPEHLKPRGGSAYWGEIDSNLTAWNDGSGNITLHWNKIRGAPWEPVNLTLRPYVLLGFAQPDGDSVHSVIADIASDEQAEAIEEQTRSDEDLLLLAMTDKPKGNYRAWADACGWKGGKNRVQRLLGQLKADGLVRLYRRQWVVTEKGRKEAAEARIGTLR